MTGWSPHFRLGLLALLDILFHDDTAGGMGSSGGALPPDDGEQRLALALELHELSCDVAREGIRHQDPGITETEVERRLRQRYELVTRP